MVLTWLVAGCIKSGGLAVADQRPIAVVAVVDAANAADTADAPERFDAAVVDAARARGLVPTVHDHTELVATLTARRETTLRIAPLRAELPTGPILLVETRPAYYAEMAGQYRWIVGVTVTLVDEGDAAVLSERFDVPVFLRYHHQRETDAVDASRGVVARHVGELVDTWLGAGG